MRFLAPLLVASAIATGASASDLNVGGDGYFMKATTALNKAFKKPGVKVVESSDVSADPIKALIDHKLHVVRVGREPEDFEITESGGRLTALPVSQDGIAIIVNPARYTHLQKMVKGQLRDIFYYGKYKEWSKIRPELKGPIHVYGLDPDHSSIAQTLHRMLMGKSHINQVPDAIIQSDPDHVVSAVAADADGIGYIPTDAMVSKVNAIEVGDDWAYLAPPTPFYITQGQYLLTRRTYLAYLKDNADAKAYVEFAASPTGQDVIVREGYLPYSGK